MRFTLKTSKQCVYVYIISYFKNFMCLHKLRETFKFLCTDFQRYSSYPFKF